jgi:isoleucyl-tRNA synthetase
VRVEAHAGLSAAADGGYLAALRTVLTPELEREGLARELVRRIQDMRKDAGFNVADRIQIEYAASERLGQAVREHHAAIAGEVLALRLDAATHPSGEASADLAFDGETIRLGVRRV